MTEHASLGDSRSWEVTITVSFNADNDEDAYAVADRMLDRVLEHPAAVEGEMAYEEIR